MKIPNKRELENEYTYSFKNIHTINTFSRDTFNNKITLEEADDEDQIY